MSFKERFISAILIFVLIATMLPVSVFCDEFEKDKIYVKTRITGISDEGDVELDIDYDAMTEAGFSICDKVRVDIESRDYSEKMPYFVSDSDSKPGKVALLGSGSNLALSIAKGDFSEEEDFDDTDEGEEVIIYLHEKGTYKDEYNMRNPERSNERSDYSSDAAYANFREVATGNIAHGVLYRSSSPINNVMNRAEYASEKMEEAGVRTVVNLADSYKKAEDYLDDGMSEYYARLYEEGNVTCLDLNYEFAGDEFNEGIVDAVEFMSLHEPPYLVHCTEGKDRTGFLIIVLEALMGASDSEMTSDYMLTYKNFYHYDKDSTEFDYAKRNYLKEIYMDLADADNKRELKHIDYHQAALDFLAAGGVTQEQIDSVISKLEDKDSNYTKIPSLNLSPADTDEKGRITLPLQKGIRAYYNGKDVKPGKNTLIVNDTYMYNGRDYKVSYKDNEHSGMMTMTVTFMKKTEAYEDGIKKVTFPVYINPQKVDEENISVKMSKDKSRVRFVVDRNRDEHINKKYYIVSPSKGSVIFKGDYIGSRPLPK